MADCQSVAELALCVEKTEDAMSSVGFAAAGLPYVATAGAVTSVTAKSK